MFEDFGKTKGKIIWGECHLKKISPAKRTPSPKPPFPVERPIRCFCCLFLWKGHENWTFSKSWKIYGVSTGNFFRVDSNHSLQTSGLQTMAGMMKSFKQKSTQNIYQVLQSDLVWTHPQVTFEKGLSGLHLRNQKVTLKKLVHWSFNTLFFLLVTTSYYH